MSLIYLQTFLFASINSSSLYLKFSQLPVYKFNLAFINSFNFFNSTPSVSGHLMDIDQFDFHSNKSIEKLIFMTNSVSSYLIKYPLLIHSLALIIPEDLISINDIKDEKNLKIFTMTYSKYQTLDYYIKKGYHFRNFTGEIIFDSDYTLFNLSLFIVFIVFSFAVSMTIISVFYVKLKNIENKKLQIHSLLIKIPFSLGMICIVEYFSSMWSDSYYKCFSVVNLVEISLTCLFSIEKSLIMTSIILISQGWMIVNFIRKKKTILYMFISILLSDFILDVIIRLFEEEAFQIPPMYYLEIKNFIEIFWLMIYSGIISRKVLGKIYEQYQYEIKIKSGFANIYRMKYKMFLSFLVVVGSFFVGKITAFAIHFFCLSIQFSYPFFYADHTFIEAIFGCALMTIFIPRPLPEFYFTDMKMEECVFVAKVGNGYKNKIGGIKKDRKFLIIVNPSGNIGKGELKDINGLYNSYAVNIGVIDIREDKKEKNCEEFLKETCFGRIYTNRP